MEYSLGTFLLLLYRSEVFHKIYSHLYLLHGFLAGRRRGEGGGVSQKPDFFFFLKSMKLNWNLASILFVVLSNALNSRGVKLGRG